MDDTKPDGPLWKKILAGVLDFSMIFWGGGLLIARLTGGLTPNGFKLEGGPAIAWFALCIAYFWIGNRYFGGTLWKHILGTKPLRLR